MRWVANVRLLPPRADAAGFKRAPGVSVIPSKIDLRPVPVPSDLQIPVRCEALVTMPDTRNDQFVGRRMYIGNTVTLPNQ